MKSPTLAQISDKRIRLPLHARCPNGPYHEVIVTKTDPAAFFSVWPSSKVQPDFTCVLQDTSFLHASDVWCCVRDSPQSNPLHPSDFCFSFHTLLAFLSRIKPHNLVITRLPGFPQIKRGSTTAILL